MADGWRIRHCDETGAGQEYRPSDGALASYCSVCVPDTMDDAAESRDGWAELAGTYEQGDWASTQRALADMATSLHETRDFIVTHGGLGCRIA
jgi:hypothetical protein